MKHRIVIEQILGVTFTPLWFYARCECGYTSQCFPDKRYAQAARGVHLDNTLHRLKTQGAPTP